MVQGSWSVVKTKSADPPQPPHDTARRAKTAGPRARHPLEYVPPKGRVSPDGTGGGSGRLAARARRAFAEGAPVLHVGRAAVRPGRLHVDEDLHDLRHGALNVLLHVVGELVALADRHL